MANRRNFIQVKDKPEGHRPPGLPPVRLLPLGVVIDRRTPKGRRALLKHMRNALRAERQRGLAGHWSYDANQHRALIAAYRAERQAGGIRRLHCAGWEP